MLLAVAFSQASDVIGGLGTAAVAPTLAEAARFSRRGFGGRMAYGTPQPGRKVSPIDVKSFSDAPLYDLKTLRTVFLDFRQTGWEAELESNNRRDIDVPATVTIDGTVYKDVGVRFRGNSSGVDGPGGRRSFGGHAAGPALDPLVGLDDLSKAAQIEAAGGPGAPGPLPRPCPCDC